MNFRQVITVFNTRTKELSRTEVKFTRDNYTENCNLPSVAFFCPICINIWARKVLFKDNLTYPIKAIVSTVPCKECEDSQTNKQVYPYAGSLYDVFDGVEQLDLFPDELLLRELELLMEIGDSND